MTTYHYLQYGHTWALVHGSWFMGLWSRPLFCFSRKLLLSLQTMVNLTPSKDHGSRIMLGLFMVHCPWKRVTAPFSQSTMVNGQGVLCPLTFVHGAWIEFSSLVGGVGVRLFWLNFTFHDLRHEAISRMFKIY